MIRMAEPLTVLVYEYFSGGGSPEGGIPDGLAAEALGMLWAILADFKEWGAVHTVSALDTRFENRVPGLNRHTLPAGEIVSAAHGEHEKVFLSLLNRCDAALVIAPETDGILSGLSAEVEASGRTLLGSTSAAILRSGNKAACAGILAGANLPVPETRTVRLDSVHAIAGENSLPLVLKPLDGIGSEGVCLVSNLDEIDEAVEIIRCVTSHSTLLCQPYIEGIHASVSVLAAADRSVPLSLNLQRVCPGKPFVYSGSTVPFHYRNSSGAMDLACRAVRQIPGLRGYVGVDLVMSEDSVEIIEINPRLTTSYIGLRQVSGKNLSALIYDACVREVLPGEFSLNGQVDVAKDSPCTWGLELET